MIYYEMFVDMTCEAWSLALADDTDVWKFSSCETLDIDTPVDLVIEETGPRVDYNLTAFGTPIATARLAKIISRFASKEAQLFPACLSRKEELDMFVVNIVQAVDCLDRNRSEIQYFEIDHPTKPGLPRGISRLAILPDKVPDLHLFRIKDWQVAIVVSETLKNLIEVENCTGMKFNRI